MKAARRQPPMVAVDGATPLIGERGPVTLLDAFEDATCSSPTTEGRVFGRLGNRHALNRAH